MLEEYEKHAKYLIRKYGGTEKEFNDLSDRLTSQLSIVEDEDLGSYLPAAARLIEDEKDWLYIACALHSNTAIWSNDKGFKKQGRVPAKNTAEMAEEFGTL